MISFDDKPNDKHERRLLSGQEHSIKPILSASRAPRLSECQTLHRSSFPDESQWSTEVRPPCASFGQYEN